MAIKSHHGSWSVGDVLVLDDGDSCVLNGVKVLKAFWLDETMDYQYIVQSGSVKDNEWVPFSDGKHMSVLTMEYINSNYCQRWTKDTLAPVKGDVLVGNDRNGNEVVLLFEDDYLVHRLTPMNDSSRYQSSASFGFYKERLTDIKVLKDTSGGRLFSSI